MSHIGISGNAGQVILKNIDKKKSKFIKIFPPFLKHYEKISPNIKKCIDAIILIPVANINNPDSRWDLRLNYIVDVMKAFSELNIGNKVMIKFKKSNLDFDKEEKILKDLLKGFNYNFYFSNNKNLYEVIDYCNLIIGQLSTSFVEANFRKIPYYIYDPYEMGLTDKEIEKSFIHKKYIARTKDDLFRNIKESNNVQFSDRFLFNGIELDKISNQFPLENNLK